MKTWIDSSLDEETIQGLGEETIQGRKLFKGGNYMRKYGMYKALHPFLQFPKSLCIRRDFDLSYLVIILVLVLIFAFIFIDYADWDKQACKIVSGQISKLAALPGQKI